jgi:hypothetical protein
MQEDVMMFKTARVQIVGRIPSDLRRRVRALAKRCKVTLNAFFRGISRQTGLIG